MPATASSADPRGRTSRTYRLYGYMRDVRLLELLEGQWNRASLTQIEALGYTRLDMSRWVAAGRLRAVHEGVFAGRPFLDDERGRWKAATLTAPESYLSHGSSAALHPDPGPHAPA
jgi:hypothetical protein